MVMWYDVAPTAIADHDEWHRHEHMPERLSVPGFLRGSRWVTAGQGPRYFVMYEVADIATLSSSAYLTRLNNPTPWTTRVMQTFRGMTRGFCAVESSWGSYLARSLVALRFAPAPGDERALREELTKQSNALSKRQGVASVHVLRSVEKPAMTKEQSLRGADGSVEWVLLITGDDEAVLGAAGASTTYHLDQVAPENRA